MQITLPFTMKLTANTMKRSWTQDNQAVADKAAHYTQTLAQELIRLLVSVCTQGLSELYHEANSNTKKQAMIQLEKAIAEADIENMTEQAITLSVRVSDTLTQTVTFYENVGDECISGLINGERFKLSGYANLSELKRHALRDLLNNSVLSELTPIEINTYQETLNNTPRVNTLFPKITQPHIHVSSRNFDKTNCSLKSVMLKNRMYSCVNFNNIRSDKNTIFENVTLTHSTMEKMELPYLHCNNVEFRCGIKDSNLSHLVMINSIITSPFHSSGLIDTNFERAQFTNVKFSITAQNCNFEYAIFNNVSLNDSRFNAVNFKHTNFIQLDLNHCQFDEDCQFDDTSIELKLPANWNAPELNCQLNHLHWKSQGSLLTSIDSISDTYIDLKANLMHQIIDSLENVNDLSLVQAAFLDIVENKNPLYLQDEDIKQFVIERILPSQEGRKEVMLVGSEYKIVNSGVTQEPIRPEYCHTWAPVVPPDESNSKDMALLSNPPADSSVPIHLLPENNHTDIPDQQSAQTDSGYAALPPTPPPSTPLVDEESDSDESFESPRKRPPNSMAEWQEQWRKPKCSSASENQIADSHPNANNYNFSHPLENRIGDDESESQNGKYNKPALPIPKTVAPTTKRLYREPFPHAAGGAAIENLNQIKLKKNDISIPKGNKNLEIDPDSSSEEIDEAEAQRQWEYRNIPASVYSKMQGYKIAALGGRCAERTSIAEGGDPAEAGKYSKYK